MVDREIANFFWIGELSIYEIKCIESFIKHNFIVRVWSFAPISDLPEGAEWCDATNIISNDLLNKVNHPMTDELNIKKDNHANYAAISDIFRTHIGSKIDGWYFDADCFCLKDQEEFKSLRQNKPFVLSYEDCNHEWYVNNACMFAIPEISLLFARVTEQKCLEYNYEFPSWTFIGPSLISDIIKSIKSTNYIGKYSDFYSIHWNEMDHFLDPSLLQMALDKTKDSYVTHVWNSQLNQKYDIKNKLPPEGSFLDYLFKSLD